ncbi:MAG: hypothetical protein WB764_04975 [Xanthobacteraceae bacterium]
MMRQRRKDGNRNLPLPRLSAIACIAHNERTSESEIGMRALTIGGALDAVGRQTASIGLAIGAVIEKHKMRKHFDIKITDTTFSLARKGRRHRRRSRPRPHIHRTHEPGRRVHDDAATRRSYKSLSQVEGAFRCIKRPTFTSGRCITGRPIGCAHVFLYMLAYYLEWHMRRKLAPLLFDDTDKDAAETLRKSLMASARRSPRGDPQADHRRHLGGVSVHSFRTLLADLATLARNTIITAITPGYPLTVLSKPRPMRRRALELMEIAL